MSFLDRLLGTGYSDTSEEVQPWQNVTNSGAPVQDWEFVSLGDNQWFGPDGVIDLSYLSNARDNVAMTSEQIMRAAGADPSGLGKIVNNLRNVFKKDDGSTDWAALGTAAFGLYNATKGKDEGGYNKPVPKAEVIAGRPQYDDTNRRPGEAGRRYFTNPTFVAQGDTASK